MAEQEPLVWGSDGRPAARPSGTTIPAAALTPGTPGQSLVTDGSGNVVWGAGGSGNSEEALAVAIIMGAP